MNVFILILFCLSWTESKNYQNYHLVKATPLTEEGLLFLKHYGDNLDFDFWIFPKRVNQSAEILVPNWLYNNIKDHLEKAGVELTMLTDDIQKYIDEETSASALLAAEEETNTYLTYKRIVELIKRYADNYDHVSLKKYGESYEGRALYALKFSVGPGKKTIVVEAGMHSREWIAIASTLKVIESLATKRDTDTEVREMLERYDWLFLPMTNPDGYHMTHTADRMWRKNMKPSSEHCNGTDLNRNFKALWGGVGASKNPCQSTYHGKNVFSEPETKSISTLIKSIQNKIAYFSVHAYSQYILTPYGCQKKKPCDSDHLTYVAEKAKDAIYNETKHVFTVGTPPDIMYIATGTSYDWAKLEMKIKYAYSFELRPDRYSGRGFIMPKSQIQPSYRELFVALQAFAKNFKKKKRI